MEIFPLFYRASLWESGSQVLDGFTIQHHWESALCWYCSKYGDTAVNRVNRVSSHWVYVLLGLEKETAHKQINTTLKNSVRYDTKKGDLRQEWEVTYSRHRRKASATGLSWVRGEKIRKLVGQRQIIKGLVGSDSESGFYMEWNRTPLESFRRRVT